MAKGRKPSQTNGGKVKRRNTKRDGKISEKLGKLEGFITTDNTDEIPPGDNALEKQLESHRKKEKAINKEYDKAVNTLRDIHNLVTKIVNYGHVELLEPAVTAVQKRLDFAESQKLIPPEISPAVIERSLDTGHCFLCETELTDNSRKTGRRYRPISSIS